MPVATGFPIITSDVFGDTSASAADLDQIAGLTPGTTAASKALVVDSNKSLDTLSLVELKIGASGSGVAIAATPAEINSACDDSARYLDAGGTETLDDTGNKKCVKLDTLGGSVVTLPAASGSGVSYRFIVTVKATSNSHIIKVANAADSMCGIIYSRDDTSDNAVAFAATTGDDTVTLNRTTTGSVSVGEWLEVEDIAANLWHVRGFISNTGTPATPFSATVS